MDVLEAIAARRSIRKYTQESVSQEQIRELLKSAMMAPSARNEQPWHFIVILQESMRKELAKTSPYTHMAANAPLNIVVAGDMNEEKAPQMWVQDCAAATQNLLLAATGLGLGAVWCGVHPVEERVAHIRKTLKLPENIVPFNLICIGVPAESPSAKGAYAPERVHHEIW